jgi:hypothetical protein
MGHISKVDCRFASAWTPGHGINILTNFTPKIDLAIKANG